MLAAIGYLVYDSVLAIPDGAVGLTTSRIQNLGPIPTAPRILGPGLHAGIPVITHLKLYNTRVQIMVLDVPVGNGAKFRLTAQARLDPDSVVVVDRRMGQNYMKEVIVPTLSAVMEKEIYASRGDLVSGESQQKILDAVRTAMSLDGLTLDQAVLTHIERLEFNSKPPADSSADESDDQDTGPDTNEKQS